MAMMMMMLLLLLLMMMVVVVMMMMLLLMMIMMMMMLMMIIMLLLMMVMMMRVMMMMPFCVLIDLHAHRVLMFDELRVSTSTRQMKPARFCTTCSQVIVVGIEFDRVMVMVKAMVLMIQYVT